MIIEKKDLDLGVAIAGPAWSVRASKPDLWKMTINQDAETQPGYACVQDWSN